MAKGAEVMDDWREDGQAAEHQQQEALRRDIEETLIKVSPYLSKDELALLSWATGTTRGRT